MQWQWDTSAYCYPPTFSGKTIKSVFARLSPSKSEVSWLGDGPCKAILSATWLLSVQKKASKTSTLNSNCHGSCCLWLFESDRWILSKLRSGDLFGIQTKSKLENLDANEEGYRLRDLLNKTRCRKFLICDSFRLTFHPDGNVCATVVATWHQNVNKSDRHSRHHRDRDPDL